MPSNLPPRVVFLRMPRVFVVYALQTKMDLDLRLQSRIDQLVWLKPSPMEHSGLLTHSVHACHGYSCNHETPL